MSTISRTPCDIPLWSEADVALHPLNVRFTPKSGRWGLAAKCLLYASSRAMFPNPLGAASAPLRVRVLDPRQYLLIEFYLKLEHLDLQGG